MKFKFNEMHGKFMDYERSQVQEYIKENELTLIKLLSEKDMEIVQIDITEGNETVGKIIPMKFIEYAFTRVSDDVIEIEKIQK